MDWWSYTSSDSVWILELAVLDWKHECYQASQDGPKEGTKTVPWLRAEQKIIMMVDTLVSRYTSGTLDLISPSKIAIS